MHSEFSEKTDDCTFFDGLKRTYKILAPNTSFDDLSSSEIEAFRKQKFYNLALGHQGNGVLAYQFQCADCNRCIPLRINLAKAIFSKNQTRILKKHDAIFDIDIFNNEGWNDNEEYRVLSIYRRHRNIFAEDFSSTAILGEASSNAFTMHIREGKYGPLVAQAYMDLSVEDRALNLATHMYDPTFSNTSLGTYIWLKTIEIAKHPCSGIDYIYPGAWAKGGANLDYKKRFPGLETIVDGQWVDFDPEAHTTSPRLIPIEKIPEIT